jgi:hypothetical protein
MFRSYVAEVVAGPSQGFSFQRIRRENISLVLY